MDAISLESILVFINTYLIPNMNLLLLCLSLLVVYGFFKTHPQVKTVKDTAGEPVKVMSDPKLLARYKLLQLISSLLGLLAMILACYSALIGAWTPFTNIMLFAVGLVATANNWFRFPWAGLVTLGILGGLLFLVPVSWQASEAFPYIAGGIGLGGFGILYVKLKFLEDFVIALNTSARKVALIIAVIGVVEGVLTLF